MFIIPVERPGTLARLAVIYPGGEIEKRFNNLGDVLFSTYKVPARQLYRAAPPDSSFLEPDATFGRFGTGYGEVQSGASLTVGAEGRIYVADANRRITVYDRDGEPVATYGRAGRGKGSFGNVVQVALAPDGTVMGLDGQTGWVERYAPDGRWLSRVGGPDLVQQGVGLVVLPDASILVADAARLSLLRFAPSGDLIESVGSKGTGPAQFQSITSLTSTADGTLYAADDVNKRVMRFGPDLSYRGAITLDLPRESPKGLSIAVDHEGVIYAATGSAEVWRYGATGRREWQVGRRRDGRTLFGGPVSLTMDQPGSLYVLGGHTAYIYRFDVQKLATIAA